MRWLDDGCIVVVGLRGVFIWPLKLMRGHQLYAEMNSVFHADEKAGAG